MYALVNSISIHLIYHRVASSITIFSFQMPLLLYRPLIRRKQGSPKQQLIIDIPTFLMQRPGMGSLALLPDAPPPLHQNAQMLPGFNRPFPPIPCPLIPN